ncbi:SprT family zinc-dependent metalloprotease [Bacillus sp. T3]|uniref:M48 family metallopeptidase n=1 Tax=Bacillus sp. T3 TaxID=467262 RepID=UPI002980EEF9|nr:SprT family zinc-dependent metalloprotease [Bacillus sp. T3]
MIHTYLDETLSFELIYKNRKTVGIYIDFYGNVEVQAPKGTSEEKVLSVIEEKWGLIKQRIKEMKDRLAGPKEVLYEQGERFLYLGKDYPILISEDKELKKDKVVFEQGTLYIYVKQFDKEQIQKALKRFYYQQCKRLVEKRIQYHQNQFKIKPRSIRISDSKTTWGTCDGLRQLTFNWKLAMAPLEVIDYVVVHEMCHMVHLNHDRSFWRLVGKIMPDYEQRESWLALSQWRMDV